MHPFLRRVYERFALPQPPVSNGSAKGNISLRAAADGRLQIRLNFDLVTALIYVIALNGSSVLKILLILFFNYMIATILPRKAIPAMTWVFNIAILFANELAQGYRYSAISEGMALVFPTTGDWGKLLDSYGGLMPRWEVLFKLTILRMISFNLDYYWSLDRSRAGSPLEVCSSSPLPFQICPFLCLCY